MDNTDSPRVSPKDVFLHLLAIITLYSSAIALGTLLFQYIDYWFPALRDAYYYKEGLTSAMRFAISTLIVVFPVYFFVSRMLRKAYEADPGRLNLTIRKWLAYFTLFLSAAIAIGWLVAVINKFLEGDFTTAFLLKALVIFFITGSIFYYYRSITQGEENKQSVRNFGYGVSAVILASVIAAFFLVGSPGNVRLQKEDSQRVSDLGMLQNNIANFWQAKNSLPTTLQDLNTYGAPIPKDPNGSDYAYSVKGQYSFDLCATFSTVSNDKNIPQPAIYGPYTPGISNSSDWSHPAGYHCFSRTIDPAFFKNYGKLPM
jgi:type II secretory pathway pseudopilin PulG